MADYARYGCLKGRNGIMAGRRDIPGSEGLASSDNAEIVQLRQEVHRLMGLFQNMLQADSIQHIVSCGIEELSAKLAPLSQLGNLVQQRTIMSPQALTQLAELRSALAAPAYADWPQDGSLQSHPLSSIGEKKS
jgi:hypothetical protein